MTEYIQVITSTDSEKLAKEILQALLESRLAACGYITHPFESLYWWQSKIVSTKEWGCIVKTRADLFPAVEKLIRSKHSYEIPEIMALPVLKVSKPYMKWMEGELKK